MPKNGGSLCNCEGQVSSWSGISCSFIPLILSFYLFWSILGLEVLIFISPLAIEQIVHKKTATALCLTSVKNEDKLEFSKIVEAVKVTTSNHDSKI